MKINPRNISSRLAWIARAPLNLIYRAVNHPGMKPRWLVLDLTSMCNSKCKHCNIWAQKKYSNEISSSELIRALKDPLFSNITMVSITGGEAVLRKDIKEIIFEMSKALPKAKIWLSTNGILADRVLEVTNFALKNKVNFGVGVSLDGIGEKHDQVRGIPGNFKKVDYLLKELQKIKERHKDLAVTIGFTLSNLTTDSVFEVKEYAKKYNIYLTAQLYDEASYYHNVHNEKLNPEKIISILKRMDKSIYHDSMIKAMKNKLKYKCFALHSFCVLRYTGEITPCLRLAHISIGNIRKDSPTNIWKSERAKKVREIVKKCPGCLNTWGVCWSYDSYSYHNLKYLLKNLPRIFNKAIKDKEISI